MAEGALARFRLTFSRPSAYKRSKTGVLGLDEEAGVVDGFFVGVLEAGVTIVAFV